MKNENESETPHPGPIPISLEIGNWKLEIGKLAVERGDILLATVPRTVPLTAELQVSLARTFTNLLHDKGVRVLIRNEDIALDKLADLLTAEDIHRIMERMEKKRLGDGDVLPVQTEAPHPDPFPIAPPTPQRGEGEAAEKINIILNTREAQCDRQTSYEQIVALAGYAPDRILSVTYYSRSNGDRQRSGILSPGKSLEAEAGMILNVADTSGA